MGTMLHQYVNVTHDVPDVDQHPGDNGTRGSGYYEVLEGTFGPQRQAGRE